ncbi:hydroxyisourate hydrolase [Serratia marcescens]|uniref:hydroxyisourate hydrolase n=2 Tax=Serratia TaxID=613 RepID=UPI001EF89DFA|nr:hydroxyisourate hydrolase [Serratia marcescens]
MEEKMKIAIGLAIGFTLSPLSFPTLAETMKNPISIHVLNLQSGEPSIGMTVLLERQEGQNWLRLSSQTTDSQGRIAALYPKNEIVKPGVYKVTFETQAYFTQYRQISFYPEVPVIIHIEDPNRHYHIPLLVSQYGYSTYRGS